MNENARNSQDVKLSRGELWLLERGIYHSVAIAHLVWENHAQLFNVETHGMSEEEIVECLLGMFERGWIAVDFEPPVALNEAKIRAALKETPRYLGDQKPLIPVFDQMTQYYLTKEGGAVWEFFTQPRWDRFVLEDRFEDDWPNGSATYNSLDRDRLETYCKVCQFKGFKITSDIAFERIGSWQPVYWKSLDQGFAARFTYHDGEFELNSKIELSQISEDEWRIEYDKQMEFYRYRDSWCRWM